MSKRPSAAAKMQLINALDSAGAAIRLYRSEADPTTLVADLAKWTEDNMRDLAQEVERA